MSADFEKGRFSRQNHEMQHVQVERAVVDLEINEISYIRVDQLLIDINNRVWINAFAVLFSADELPEPDERQPLFALFARIIRTEDGIVVDHSNFNCYDWSDYKFQKETFEMRNEEDGPFLPLPVTSFITNEDELEVQRPIIEGYNITLEGTELPEHFYEQGAHIELGWDDDDYDDDDVEYEDDPN